MKKIFFVLITICAITFSSSAQPAVAYVDNPTPTPTCPYLHCVYVDPSRSNGIEDGSPNSPYSNEKEGKAWAQVQDEGAYLYVMASNGWQYKEKVREVSNVVGGSPLPNTTLYALLGVLALLLILLGRYLHRRSYQIRS